VADEMRKKVRMRDTRCEVQDKGKVFHPASTECRKTLIPGCSKRSRCEAREKSTSGGVFTDTLERGDRAQRKQVGLFQQPVIARLKGGRMKVYQRLAADFVAEGVTHIFGIMGDGNMYWMHELDKLGGVKMLEVRHEGAGLGMADGWARVTRTPGVATTTCGPGVTQLATALLTASRAASPLVAFCGEFPSNDDEYLQRMDQ